jgi:hypothetical protein
VGDHAKHGAIPEGPLWAGDDDSTGSDVAGAIARKITWFEVAEILDVNEPALQAMAGAVRARQVGRPAGLTVLSRAIKDDCNGRKLRLIRAAPS